MRRRYGAGQGGGTKNGRRFTAPVAEIRIESGLGRFCLQRVLRNLHQFGEGGVVRGGEVSERLAIERDLGSFQPLDEAAVGETGGAGSGVDADLPERAEVALFG